MFRLFDFFIVFNYNTAIMVQVERKEKKVFANNNFAEMLKLFYPVDNIAAHPIPLLCQLHKENVTNHNLLNRASSHAGDTIDVRRAIERLDLGELATILVDWEENSKVFDEFAGSPKVDDSFLAALKTYLGITSHQRDFRLRRLDIMAAARREQNEIRIQTDAGNLGAWEQADCTKDIRYQKIQALIEKVMEPVSDLQQDIPSLNER